MPTETKTVLSFSDEHVEACWMTGVVAYPIDHRAIVVNLSTTPIRYAGGVEGMILPWKSTILQYTTVTSANSMVLLWVNRPTNIGGIILGKNWRWYGQVLPSFPRGTPLYISSQDAVGQVKVDPCHFTRQSDRPMAPLEFDVKVNLWFTLEQTDCVIHAGHTFLEVHTQVFGTGHMQKFLENREETLYEDVFMMPGLTHDPFPTIDPDGHFDYPWHRYFADTDCIWMAIELHTRPTT